MNCTVFIVDQAEQHLHGIDDWMRTTGHGNPNLFFDEFTKAMRLLSVTPEIGPRFTRATVPGIRRLLLRQSRHYVYYLYDRIHAIVYIIAIWSTARGTDPPLTSW